jgi:hypothetical protein
MDGSCSRLVDTPLMTRPIIHLLLHFIVPAVVARVLFPTEWKRAWVIMMLTMVVDMDHLLATPVYDPQRCGIGFHPLHSYPALLIYVLMAAISKTRLVAYGLIIHMVLDGIDCLWLSFE